MVHLRHPVDTSWLLYGDSVIPGWVLGPVLIVAVIASIRWLRAERRRSPVAGALLPYTWTILLVLAAWVVWQPGLVKISHWQEEATMLAYLDGSASMQSPLFGGTDLSTRLEVLQLMHPQALEGRPTGPRELSVALGRLLEDGSAQENDLRSLQEEIFQGLPLGETAQQTLRAYGDWAGAGKPHLRESLTAAQNAIEAMAPNERAGLKAAGEQVAALARRIELLADRIAEPSPAALQLAIQSLEALLESARQTTPALDALQSAMDRQIFAWHATTLEPLLEQTAQLTRSDMARHLLAQMPNQNLMVASDADQGDQTDIYGGVERLLANRTDQVISHLVVLSDGGHNGPAVSELTSKLKKSGIEVVTVGVGLPEPGVDLAILDFQAPPVVQAQQQLTVRATVKTPGRIPFKLILDGPKGQLASTAITPAGTPQTIVSLACKAPPPGRHQLRLRIQAEDLNPDNNAVHFIVDAVRRSPKVVLLGQLPNWDTTYFTLAARRAGFEMRQLYHAARKAPLQRGSGSDAIPRTLAQWGRHRLVIVQGRPFAGFTDEDAQTLFRFVTEQGGCLLIMADQPRSYLSALAGRFRWTEAASSTEVDHLGLPRSASFLPLMRLAADGPRSARIVASLGAPRSVHKVPAQHLVLLASPEHDPLVSLGFYGKGKVILWGLEGLQRLREYEKAAWVDRLLEQVVADAAAPLFADDQATVATYPLLPVPGRENLLLSCPPRADYAVIGGTETRLTLESGVENRIGRFTPPSSDRLELHLDDRVIEFEAMANPGMEQIDYAFNPAFLQTFASQSAGRYVPLADAMATLPSLRPRPWRSATAQSTPLAGHWLLFWVIAVLGAVHWSLRKISGLSI